MIYIEAAALYLYMTPNLGYYNIKVQLGQRLIDCLRVHVSTMRLMAREFDILWNSSELCKPHTQDPVSVTVGDLTRSPCPYPYPYSSLTLGTACGPESQTK